jgi:tetratricopeptide (TPR) repeat protein
MENYSEAETAFRKALEFEPNDFDAQSSLGAVDYALGRYAEAAVRFRKALNIRPGDYWTNIEQAKTAAAMGRLDEAKKAFARARSINPKLAAAFIAEGYARIGMGEDAAGEKTFETLISIDTSSPVGYHHMGAYLAGHGRLAEAEHYFRQALRMIKSDPRSDRNDLLHALTWLGIVLSREGRRADAEAVYLEGLIEFRPGSACYWKQELSLSLGRLYADEGRDPEAERLFRQSASACAGKFDAGLGWSRENGTITLARFYAERGRRAEAAALAQGAWRRIGDKPITAEDSLDYSMVLASVFGLLGDDAKAEAVDLWMLRERETTPYYPGLADVKTGLAEIRDRQGRRAEAAGLYREAARIDEREGKLEKAEALKALAAAAAIGQDARR